MPDFGTQVGDGETLFYSYAACEGETKDVTYPTPEQCPFKGPAHYEPPVKVAVLVRNLHSIAYVRDNLHCIVGNDKGVSYLSHHMPKHVLFVNFCACAGPFTVRTGAGFHWRAPCVWVSHFETRCNSYAVLWYP